MYKFTNGIIVFDEKTRDRYIEAGYRLVEEKQIEENLSKDSLENSESEEEESNENTPTDETIDKKSKRNKKVSN